MKLKSKMAFEGVLRARALRADGSIKDFGIISRKLVTDAFVQALVDTLQSSAASFSNFKYHDSGTGTTSALATDTALETACGDDRTVGTQIEGTAANIYKSVATHTYDTPGTTAITEWGLFNVAAVGTLLDRAVFTAILIVNGDRIEFTYTLTCNSGG